MNASASKPNDFSDLLSGAGGCAREAQKDDACLGALDAVVRAVIAGSGVAADDTRVVQLLYRRVAGEVARHIGVGAVQDCQIGRASCRERV